MICGTEAPQSADIVLEIDGEEHRHTAQGDGPVDAAFNAVSALVPHHAALELYQVHAVTEGTDAQATVSVRLRENGFLATAQASDTDTVVASTRAYVQCLNKLMVRRHQVGPQRDGRGQHRRLISAENTRMVLVWVRYGFGMGGCRAAPAAPEFRGH